MSGIYIHIPFCRQACHYCDFHFSTSMKNKDALVDALCLELELRKGEARGDVIETIYFGGGTPSLLSDEQSTQLLDTVFEHYNISPDAEITLEANPDDLDADTIIALRKKFNRLSIGIQSFFDEDLQLMNRAHNAAEARETLAVASQYFDNISIDLIYGTPGMDDHRWRQNIELALSFPIPHLSSYALTVEPKTPLYKMVETKKIESPREADAERHFNILTEILSHHGFIHYELSNFAKPGYFSRNNSAYWLGKKYLGIGPSAHSFDGASRSWNVSNNSAYLKSITANKLPSEIEILTPQARYNETILTGLRTMWGISSEMVESQFGKQTAEYLIGRSRRFIETGLLTLDDGILRATAKGKFLVDGIASDLFLVS